MFLKIIVATDEDPENLEALLDVLNDRVDPATDIIILPGMVADALEPASTYENVHSKIIIDATIIPESDPRSSSLPPEGSFQQESPDWRRGVGDSIKISGQLEKQISQLENVCQIRVIRNNMLVITTNIEARPDPRVGQEWADEDNSTKQKEVISQLRKSIWQLDKENAIRWLFITDDDFELNSSGARRRLLWQLTSRFTVERDLTIEGSRLCWDATTPIPSRDSEQPVRRWPATTMHDPETLAAIERFDLPPWPENLVM